MEETQEPQTYETIAREIVLDTIKSAVYIDENAYDFYEAARHSVNSARQESNPSTIVEDSGTEPPEKELSLNMFNDFKDKSIFLQVHKYDSGNESDDSLKNYLFNNTDLVLLDWKLKGIHDEGETSLKFLADIVDRPNIHFCAIYTSQSDAGLISVFNNILSYFSNYDASFYENLSDKLFEDIDDNLENVLSLLRQISLYRFDSNVVEKYSEELRKEYKQEYIAIRKATTDREKYIDVSIALDKNLIKSEFPHPSPSYFDFENNVLVINNTIIFLFNKNENKPNILIDQICKQLISQTDYSFMPLLGLEVQALVNKESWFFNDDENFCTIRALMFKRANDIKSGVNNFSEFLIDMISEKLKTNLQNRSLKLLSDESLMSFDEIPTADVHDIVAMNVFYNSVKLKGSKIVNFGDVYVDKDQNYYLCITPVCDCLRPDIKIKKVYFFAKGQEISNEEALKLGDSGFISFIDRDKCVCWTNKIPDKPIEFYENTSLYIKPKSYTIVNNSFQDDENITIFFVDTVGRLKKVDITYLTTLRTNYAQRIANHAFAYPIRVGVDFA